MALISPAIPKEFRPAADYPPTFLMHTHDDRLLLSTEHAVAFYQALKEAGVSAELHVYARGGPVFGLRRPKPGTAAWPEALVHWLAGMAASDR